MFEDSTFESAGRIRTRSRRWMIAAFTFNASILLAFVLVPLIRPEALPPQFQTFLCCITVPPAPHVQEQVQKPATPTSQPTAVPRDPFAAPRQIPTIIYIAKNPEPAPISDPSNDNSTPGGIGDNDNPLFVPAKPHVVRQAPSGPAHLPSTVSEGLVIHKTIPVYPAIARTVHAQGTVVLAATISKNGTIENLRVVSGPPLLQQSAVDAVSTWRYRPYLLNGQPVEVETTVNVIFTMAQ